MEGVDGWGGPSAKDIDQDALCEFLAQIRGWQLEERKQRKEQLLQLNDIGLRIALGHEAGTDVFLILKAHFAKEIPDQGDEEHWLPNQRMAEKATCHMQSVCPGTACRTGVEMATPCLGRRSSLGPRGASVGPRLLGRHPWVPAQK